MALRRATRDDDRYFPFETDGLAAAGGRMLDAMAELAGRPRRVVVPAGRSVALQLARFAADLRMQIGARVALPSVVPGDVKLHPSARRDHLDFVLRDAEGHARCGIFVGRAPAWAQGGARGGLSVPLVTLRPERGWAANRERLVHAMDLAA
jgi:hypothetical protein